MRRRNDAAQCNVQTAHQQPDKIDTLAQPAIPLSPINTNSVSSSAIALMKGHSSPSVLPPIQVFLHIIRRLRRSSRLEVATHSSASFLSLFPNPQREDHHRDSPPIPFLNSRKGDTKTRNQRTVFSILVPEYVGACVLVVT